MTKLGRPSRYGPRETLVGRKFGKLTLLELVTNSPQGIPAWRCICECGGNLIGREANILNGHTRSCGCINRERAKRGLSRKHGMANTPTYFTWRSMKKRCLDPKSTGYKYYGGRGVTICHRWLAFENFLLDMGPRPNGTTIERRNTNGNYEPNNCYWATAKSQARNRRNNKIISFRGENLCVSAWAERLGTYPQKIFRRLEKGLSPAEIFASVRCIQSANPQLR